MLHIFVPDLLGPITQNLRTLHLVSLMCVRPQQFFMSVLLMAGNYKIQRWGDFHTTFPNSRSTGAEVIVGDMYMDTVATISLSSPTKQSRDSSAGITLGYGLDNRGSRVRFPAGAGNFSLHHRARKGSGAHSASYPMGTRDFFPVGKVAGA
jgi:hypothetical protein